MDTVNFVNRDIASTINHKINISGVLLTFFDTRTKLSREVLENVEEIFGKKMFKSTIPQNIKLNEAQSHGKAIYDWSPKCKGAAAYMTLTREVLNRGVKKK